jgi:LuxR family maltose regulon positive regulatory protein
MFVRANLARFRGDLLRFVALTREALAVLPQEAKLQRDVARLSLLASDHLIGGDVSVTSERTFREALAVVAEAGDVSALLRGKVVLAGMQRLQGRLRHAEASFRAAADMLSDSRVVPGLVDSAAYYVGLGDLLRERNDLDAAEQYLTEGRNVARGTMITSADVIALGYIALARVSVARGDWEGADALMDELVLLVDERSFTDDVIGRIRAARARLALLRGDLEGALVWASASSLQAHDDVAFFREFEYLTLARVSIADGRYDSGSESCKAALQLLDRWHDAATTRGRWSIVIETLILRSLALAALGDEQTAMTMLERAVERAAPEGYMRLFVDEGASMYDLLHKLNVAGMANESYYHALLNAFDMPTSHRVGNEGRNAAAVSSAPASSSALVEPLTERELEVLRLLASGASNQAIADQLVISLATAKKHVNNIFGKLQAQNRTEAVVRARDVHLIP